MKTNGLATVLNTIISPGEAFEAIRATPTWGWAFLIAEILALVGSIIILPAVQHAFDLTWATQVATNPRLSQMSAEQQAQAESFSKAIVNITPILALLTIPISMLLQTIVMLLFNALGRGSATFQTLWASVANISVVGTGLGSIVLGIIVLAHGVQNINSTSSVQLLMPSLALLVPNAPIKLVAILSQINPFTLWVTGLIIVAMSTVARVPKLHAWLTGIVILMLPAAFAAAFAR